MIVSIRGPTTEAEFSGGFSKKLVPFDWNRTSTSLHLGTGTVEVVEDQVQVHSTTGQQYYEPAGTKFRNAI